jgi:hypothetical protein
MRARERRLCLVTNVAHQGPGRWLADIATLLQAWPPAHGTTANDGNPEK